MLYLLSDLVDQETAEWDDIMAFARPYAALGEPWAEVAYKYAMGIA